MRKSFLLVSPYWAWMVFFVAIPVSLTLFLSFARRGPYGGIVWALGFNNYFRVFDFLYLRVLWNSVELASMATFSCLMLGFPLAWIIATSQPRAKKILLLLIVLPFLTNFVVRVYSLKFFLSQNGPLVSLIKMITGKGGEIILTENAVVVWYGMVSNYLPFMILPIYAVLEKFDMSLLEASRDLGAGAWHQFWRVIVPLTRAGVITGCILVFMPAMGEFVIPAMLGGARTVYLGTIITEQFLRARDWPFGAALSAVMLILVFALLACQRRMEKERV